ncbi:MAG: NAD(+)/NADH kinase [Mycoplasmoidaceae bacterium]
MYKYLIINNNSEKSLLIQNKLKRLLNHEWEIDENKPQYVFVIGGDGTFLKSLNKINQFPNAFIIPINGGNFGFYSHFNIDNLNEILPLIHDHKNYYNPLIIDANLDHQKYLAINEIFLTKHKKTLMIEIEVNGILYEKFIGSGIIISTPTGSTGRSKSAGGAVLCSKMDLIQLVEVEPINQKEHNTLMVPIIFDSNVLMKIAILNDSDLNPSFMIIDGNNYFELTSHQLKLSFHKAAFQLFKPSDFNTYVSKLRKAFISEE